MKEELITFDTAKLAKEKGFNDTETYVSYHYCISSKEAVLDGDRLFKEIYIPAPTQSLLQKWLREYDIHLSITIGINGYYCFMPRQTMERTIEHLRNINYEASYYLRTVQWENKNKEVFHLALMQQ